MSAAEEHFPGVAAGTSAPLELRAVRHAYKEGAGVLEVLKGIDVRLAPGELVALIAPSGAGKSTLLHIAALLERPTGGEVLIDGVDAGGLPDARRTELRRHAIGMVYQFHHLLPDFNAVENVAFPLRLAGVPARDALERAHHLLAQLDVDQRASHRPGELSGGERQRVAIARAMANRPSVILADEPTGNLDPATAERVFEAFVGLARSTGLAALVATHNQELAGRMDRRITLAHGRIVHA